MHLKSTLRLFSFLLLLHSNLFAQNFWVPDGQFRNRLKVVYPTCFTLYDSLITTCSVIQNVTTLNVNNISISSLDGIQYFTSLNTLHCENNLLTSLPSLPSTLNALYCSNNQLTSFPILPISLNLLYCNTNQLSSLPALPSSITHLECSNNQLTSLPILPSSLAYLECSNNFLTNLSSLPSTLNYLSCNNNQLNYLPSLSATLIQLSCINNHLTSLPNLPQTLTDLNCCNNQISSLTALPAALTKLNCASNQLVGLPSFPNTLQVLNCENNQLRTLPTLPTTLTMLICFNNQLINLPALPSSLTLLICSNNKLTSLPALPLSLAYLYCSNNQLCSLPRIPGYMINLLCNKNPITCFPEIEPHLGAPSWNFINIDSTLISCIPNNGNFPLSIVYPQNLPVCNPLSSGCNYNYTMGYVYLDTNSNGIKDSLEKGLEMVINYAGNSGVLTDSLGIFYATSDTGFITFVVSLPFYYFSTNPTSQTIHVQSGIIDTLYFAIQQMPIIKDLKIDLNLIGFLRPGFKANYKLNYQNQGTDVLNNVQLKFLKPLSLSNLYSIPAANSINGDTLIWNFASLKPFEQGDVLITDSVFVNSILGSTVSAKAWILPIASDTTPLNNSAISTNIIRGAYDPNDKSVSVDSVLPNSTDDLEYTIRFQNTGTDTAFTVTLIDKLSDKLDVSSMHMISASHNYELSIVNGFAKWIFKNILLPDSNTNELESHGFVKFSIKPKPGLTVTDSIQNKADIYFDYNAAVTTNTIVVNVLNPLQVQELKETELQIFPNPVQDILRIVNQHAGALGKIELINANGKVLETKTISSSTYTWNLQHLPAGTYILKGQGWGQKVVKE